MDRRDFIKLTAITGTSATLASCGNPEHQLIRFVPDDDIVPGVAEWKPSVCPLCAAGCGVSVRVMDADVDTTRNGQAGVVKMGVAKKLEGNAKDPISHGGLCARGQASIQITYHPDRLTHPMKRTGARGAATFTDDHLGRGDRRAGGAARRARRGGDQKSLVFLTRPRRGRRRRWWPSSSNGFGAPPPIAYEFFADDVLRRANAISFGHEQLPTIDLARSRFAISFGADFLGTWNSPVAQNVAYGAMRQGRPGSRGAFVQVESRMSLTGANADEWVPVKPGTEGVLALGLAHVILASKLRPADGRPGGRRDRRLVGRPARLRARERGADHRRRGQAHRASRARARRVPAGGGVHRRRAARAHQRPLPRARRERAQRVARQRRPAGRAVLHARAIPICHQPSAISRSGVREGAAARRREPGVRGAEGVEGARGARQIPFIASFGSFIDDTSALADLILPDHSFLESWVDSAPESGSIEAVTTVGGPGDEADLPDARDGGRADRRGRQAEVAGRAALEDGGRGVRSLAVSASPQSAAHPQSIRNPQSAIRNTVRRAALRRRRGDLSVPLPARTRRSSSATGRPRTCRGCRRCPIR